MTELEQTEAFNSVVGIDLGTTNCTVAKASWDDQENLSHAQTSPVTQLVGPARVEQRETLPSFLYVPDQLDVPWDQLELPWEEVLDYSVGHWALEEGALQPSRCISSAKSWLSHKGIDRRQPILPLDAPEDVTLRSPTEVSQLYLEHLVGSWRYQGNQPLSETPVVLTVPASFDAVARELTVEAARRAGLEDLVLLEEPQAAFYAWLNAQGEQWRYQVAPGDHIFVCDVGGGTTDLTLIVVDERDGDLALERVAVGDHILLGGDNMDLALAYLCRYRLEEEGHEIDDWQFRGLTYSVRQAKEKLFLDSQEERARVVVPGRGSSLIGGSIESYLTREDLEQVVLNGFFPHCSLDGGLQEEQGLGLSEMGLPYAKDPAVTRHIADFLKDHPRPNKILFNGGVFHAEHLQQRVLDLMKEWGEGEAPTVLSTPSLDQAVSLGAARYGLVRQGHGLKIKAGLSRSYFMGIQVSMPAIPGFKPPTKGICVAPAGMEEGERFSLPEQKFALTVGRPVEFPFFSSDLGQEHELGEVIQKPESKLEKVATVRAELEAQESDLRHVPVHLEAVATEVGTLEVWCAQEQGEGRWRLELDLRQQEDE